MQQEEQPVASYGLLLPTDLYIHSHILRLYFPALYLRLSVKRLVICVRSSSEIGFNNKTFSLSGTSTLNVALFSDASRFCLLTHVIYHVRSQKFEKKK
jgi:hypothetical protein